MIKLTPHGLGYVVGHHMVNLAPSEIKCSRDVKFYIRDDVVRQIHLFKKTTKQHDYLQIVRK